MSHSPIRLAAALALLLGTAGCNARHQILAATGTNIGVEVSQSPSTQAPYAKLGYQRTELAIVPTNRNAETNAANGSLNNGAADHGDVIMELRYGGIFDMGESSGIYQRLAVGRVAVQEPGAAFMFARNADGKVDPAAATALKNLIRIRQSEVQTGNPIDKITALRKCHRAEVDADIRAVDPALTYDDLVDDKATTEQLEQIVAKLEARNLSPCR